MTPNFKGKGILSEGLFLRKNWGGGGDGPALALFSAAKNKSPNF